jgi:hypothetical protein
MRECLRLGVIVDTGLRDKNGRIFYRLGDDAVVTQALSNSLCK